MALVKSDRERERRAGRLRAGDLVPEEKSHLIDGRRTTSYGYPRTVRNSSAISASHGDFTSRSSPSKLVVQLIVLMMISSCFVFAIGATASRNEEGTTYQEIMADYERVESSKLGEGVSQVSSPDYQKAMRFFVENKDNTVLSLPPSGGKTFVATQWMDTRFLDKGENVEEEAAKSPDAIDHEGLNGADAVPF